MAVLQWEACDEHDVHHLGEMSFDRTALGDMETAVFRQVEPVRPKWISLRVDYSDGSASLREYEKHGEIWVRTFSDTLMPGWFSLLLVGVVVAVLGLMVAGAYYWGT